jgi:hypothetical protein
MALLVPWAINGIAEYAEQERPANPKAARCFSPTFNRSLILIKRAALLRNQPVTDL